MAGDPSTDERARRKRAKIGVFLLVVALVAAASLGWQTLLRLGKQLWAMASSTERPAVDYPEVNDLPLEGVLAQPRIEVRKGVRQLYLYDGSRLVRNFPVGLGFDPVGDKQREGDGCTPEGHFVVCVRNDKSKYFLSLGISYPNLEDARRGRRDGLISDEEFDRIAESAARGVRPPWDTALGGEIFIHGEGSGRDWTLGCVALDNPAMRELFDATPLGTPVAILP